MLLDWFPRDNEAKDHDLFGEEHFGADADAPCTVYEKTPLTDPSGAPIDDLYVATVRLNNPVTDT